MNDITAPKPATAPGPSSDKLAKGQPSQPQQTAPSQKQPAVAPSVTPSVSPVVSPAAKR